jgi:hypothetical protein
MPVVLLAPIAIVLIYLDYFSLILAPDKEFLLTC